MDTFYNLYSFRLLCFCLQQIGLKMTVEHVARALDKLLINNKSCVDGVQALFVIIGSTT
jgi:hypothetical protein